MLHAVLPIKNFLKFNALSTDNNVFRLHYKVTVIILLVSTLLATYKEFFGNPINCMGHSEKFEDAINTYCWIYGTYTLKSQLGGVEGHHVAYSGVGPEKGGEDDHIKHTYYQWVWVVLLLQAAMFYTPHYLWKLWEGGRMKNLTENLVGVVIPKADTNERRNDLVTYFAHTNLISHKMYAVRFIFCEILNLINVIGQIFLLDLFLGGSFRSYGAAVTAFNHRHRMPDVNEDMIDVNPMDKFFPKLTKCYLRTYGPSGTIQYKDLLCVLPLNIINEKIFIILWFWLIMLTFFSILALFFRMAVLTTPRLRTLLIVGQLRYIKKGTVHKLVKRFSYGDWFVLHLLGKNLNPIIYQELISELAIAIDKDGSA